MEASTTLNLKQIVARLPGPLIMKWVDTLYNIRKTGRSPKLSDLAKIVRRQADIKNDQGFVSPSLNSDTRPSKGKITTSRVAGSTNTVKQTARSTRSTNMSNKQIYNS